MNVERLAEKFTRFSARTNPLVPGMRGVSFGVDVVVGLMVLSAMSAPQVIPITVMVASAVVAVYFFKRAVTDLYRIAKEDPFYTDYKTVKAFKGCDVSIAEMYSLPRTAAVFMKDIDAKIVKLSKKQQDAKSRLLQKFYERRLISCAKTRKSILTASSAAKLPGRAVVCYADLRF